MTTTTTAAVQGPALASLFLGVLNVTAGDSEVCLTLLESAQPGQRLLSYLGALRAVLLLPPEQQQDGSMEAAGQQQQQQQTAQPQGTAAAGAAAGSVQERATRTRSLPLHAAAAAATPAAAALEARLRALWPAGQGPLESLWHPLASEELEGCQDCIAPALWAAHRTGNLK